MSLTIAEHDELAERTNLDFSKGERGKNLQAAQALTGEVFNVSVFEKECKQYRTSRAVEAEAKKQAEACKVRILTAVDKFGLVPTNAEKSRRLESKGFIVTSTTGTTVEINDTAAFEFELLLARARRSKLFSMIFSRRTEYTLAKTAAETIEHEKWPKKFADDIRNLYGRCFKATTKAPSLTVETREAFEQRERVAAEKAAKKASKKGGK